MESKVLQVICLTLRTLWWGSNSKGKTQRQHNIRLPVCQKKKKDFWCMISLCRILQTGNPSVMDHVPLLSKASLFFVWGDTNTSYKKMHIGFGSCKLLVQEVMSDIFKGTHSHHFNCPLLGIKVKDTQTHISLYRFSPVVFSLVFPQTEF